ncbi:MAG: hypothetical protein HY819_13145 [Acidobacteria bacterium]|nr:hypothetical protein [Acidobacteriota bacterium]
MNISSAMIRHHLDYVTVGWFNHNDLPPDNVEGYYKCVEQMRLNALAHNDLPYLKIAFEYLLGNSSIKCESFGDGRYPYDEEEVREIIEYAWKTIWPDAAPISPNCHPEVNLVEIPTVEWWKNKDEQTKNLSNDAASLLKNKLNRSLLG